MGIEDPGAGEFKGKLKRPRSLAYVKRQMYHNNDMAQHSLLMGDEIIENERN